MIMRNTHMFLILHYQVNLLTSLDGTLGFFTLFKLQFLYANLYFGKYSIFLNQSEHRVTGPEKFCWWRLNYWMIC